MLVYYYNCINCESYCNENNAVVGFVWLQWHLAMVFVGLSSTAD